jgi:hypothetical protein
MRMMSSVAAAVGRMSLTGVALPRPPSVSPSLALREEGLGRTAQVRASLGEGSPGLSGEGWGLL